MQTTMKLLDSQKHNSPIRKVYKLTWHQQSNREQIKMYRLKIYQRRDKVGRTENNRAKHLNTETVETVLIEFMKR
jgi:hypothetical protein